MSETSTGTLIGIEKSKAWLELLQGRIPEEITVYLILWQDRDSKRFVESGFYVSTSEPGPIGTDPQIVCEIPVPVIDTSKTGRTKRTREDLNAAYIAGSEILAKAFVYNPQYRQLFEKFATDSRYRASHKMPPMEVVSPRDYAHLMETLKGDWEARRRDLAASATEAV
jgi:hypothetical protein